MTINIIGISVPVNITAPPASSVVAMPACPGDGG
jgi:hypothetical protein